MGPKNIEQGTRVAEKKNQTGFGHRQSEQTDRDQNSSDQGSRNRNNKEQNSSDQNNKAKNRMVQNGRDQSSSDQDSKNQNSGVWRNGDQNNSARHNRIQKSRRKKNKLHESRTGRKPLTDYRRYRMTGKEAGTCIAVYCLLDLCVSNLFFDSFSAFFLLLPGLYLFFCERRSILQRKRAQEMQMQFVDGMQMMASSLQAGYSAENALKEVGRELAKIYGEAAFVVLEFRRMEIQLQMNRTIEDLFGEFAMRSGIEDIRSFSQVFVTAKRSGGDLLAIIRNTVFCIRQKQETMQEIETSLAGKVMEQNVMSLIPLLILAYVKLTSPEFLEEMYHTTAGLAVMGICFLVYVAAWYWGRRIVKIEV